MVVTGLPATAASRVVHERASWLSRSTEHAPQCPSPQPYFEPVNPSSYRSTDRRLSPGSPSTVWDLPLIRRVKGIKRSYQLPVTSCQLPVASSRTENWNL